MINYINEFDVTTFQSNEFMTIYNKFLFLKEKCLEKGGNNCEDYENIYYIIIYKKKRQLLINSLDICYSKAYKNESYHSYIRLEDYYRYQMSNIDYSQFNECLNRNYFSQIDIIKNTILSELNQRLQII